MQLIAFMLIIFIIAFIFIINDDYHSGGDVREWLWNIGMIGFTVSFFFMAVELSCFENIEFPEIIEIAAALILLICPFIPQLLFRFKTRYLLTAGQYFIMLIYIFGTGAKGNLQALITYCIPLVIIGFLLRKRENFSLVNLFITIGWTIAAEIIFNALHWTDDVYRASNLLAAIYISGGLLVVGLAVIPVNAIMNKLLRKVPRQKIGRYYIPVCLGILTLISGTSGIIQSVQYNTAEGTVMTIERFAGNDPDCYVSYTDKNDTEHILIRLYTAPHPFKALKDGQQVKIAYLKKEPPSDAKIESQPEGTNMTGYEGAREYISYLPITLALAALTAASAYLLIVKKKDEYAEERSEETVNPVT